MRLAKEREAPVVVSSSGASIFIHVGFGQSAPMLRRRGRTALLFPLETQSLVD